MCVGRVVGRGLADLVLSTSFNGEWIVCTTETKCSKNCHIGCENSSLCVCMCLKAFACRCKWVCSCALTCLKVYMCECVSGCDGECECVRVSVCVCE